jgi:hypothetical protein
MRDMFKPSMAELGLCMYQLENIVQEQIPELYLHFQSQVRCSNFYYCSNNKQKIIIVIFLLIQGLSNVDVRF